MITVTHECDDTDGTYSKDSNKEFQPGDWYRYAFETREYSLRQIQRKGVRE